MERLSCKTFVIKLAFGQKEPSLKWVYVARAAQITIEVVVKTPSGAIYMINGVNTLIFPCESACFKYQGLPGGSRVGRAPHRNDDGNGNENRNGNAHPNADHPTCPRAQG